MSVFIQEDAQQTVFFLNEFHLLKRFAPKPYSLLFHYGGLIEIADLINRGLCDLASKRLNYFKQFVGKEKLNYPY